MPAHLDVPGPPPVAALGKTGNFLRFLREPTLYLERLHQDYGDIAAVTAGKHDLVFVFSPRYVQQLLGDTQTFHNLDAASSPLRMRAGSSLARLYAGLTNMNGAEHWHHRRLAAAGFTPDRLDELVPDIVALTQAQLAGWRLGELRDIRAEMRELTLSVAVKTLLGLEPQSDGRRVRSLLELWMGMVFSVPVLMLPFDLPGLPYRRLSTVSRSLELEIRAMLAARRASSIRRRDVLSIMLSAEDEDGRRMDNDALIGQTSFLFMAGHATTASALAWTVFLLVQHPLVLTEVLHEIERVLHRRPPHAGALADLHVLERVIRESLRLFPPVIWWSRTSTRACEFGPYRFGTATRVAYSAHVMHRQPDVYPRPNRFAPQRWLDSSPGPYQFVPFSAGPRACLGAAFAMLEMKVILALLLQRWGLAMLPGSTVNRGGLMISEPRPGLLMEVRRPDLPAARQPVSGNVHRIVDLD